MIFTGKYPLQIRVEATQGCNRSCFYCGINGIEDKSIKFMSQLTFKNIIDNLHIKTKRLDFELHGEPSLNILLYSFIEYAKKQRPYLQITIISNTDVITEDYLIKMFDVGLNNFYADLYDDKQKEFFIDMAEAINKVHPEIELHDIYKTGKSPWGYVDGKHKYIFISDESKTSNRQLRKSRRLHNFAGHVPYNLWKKHLGVTIDDFPIIRKCIEPFKSVCVAYNGDIFLCCGDFGKSITFGNVNVHSIQDIWNCEDLKKIRFILDQGRRDVLPTCYFCNRRMFRTGFYKYDDKEQFDLLYLNRYFAKNTNLQESIKKLFRMKHKKGFSKNAIYDYIGG